LANGLPPHPLDIGAELQSASEALEEGQDIAAGKAALGSQARDPQVLGPPPNNGNFYLISLKRITLLESGKGLQNEII
jgi:hypothetical protein